MSSGSKAVREDSVGGEPSVAESSAANVALVSSIRASRHEAERRSLLRKSAVARAHQLLEVSAPRLARESEAAPRAHVVERAAEPSAGPELQPSCASWRAAAARQAYLSTLPPPPRDAEPLVRLCHKA